MRLNAMPWALRLLQQAGEAVGESAAQTGGDPQLVQRRALAWALFWLIVAALGGLLALVGLIVVARLRRGRLAALKSGARTELQQDPWRAAGQRARGDAPVDDEPEA